MSTCSKSSCIAPIFFHFVLKDIFNREIAHYIKLTSKNLATCVMSLPKPNPPKLDKITFYERGLTIDKSTYFHVAINKYKKYVPRKFLKENCKSS